MKNRIRYFSIITIILLWMIFTVSACKGKDMNVSGENKDVLTNSDQNDTPVAAVEKTEELTGYDSEYTPKEMYFIVQDVFTITYEGAQYSVVVGYPVNGTVSVNQEVDILYSDGRIETKVVGLEDAQGNHPTTAGEFENIAIWLDKYVKDSVKSGDLLVNRDAGATIDSVDCIVAVLEEGYVIEDGMNVTVELGSYRASSITKLCKNMDDGCFKVHFDFDKEVAMVYGQIVKIYDENSNEIAIGRSVSYVMPMVQEGEKNGAQETDFSSVQESETSKAPESSEVQQNVYKFRSKKLLNQHYEKHGIEMGFDSAAAYEEAASAVINNPDALYKTEKEDGDGVYYVEATNEFVILSTDGYIRTYFCPSGGISYFNRQ